VNVNKIPHASAVRRPQTCAQRLNYQQLCARAKFLHAIRSWLPSFGKSMEKEKPGKRWVVKDLGFGVSVS
jgi:hypothetical protein